MNTLLFVVGATFQITGFLVTDAIIFFLGVGMSLFSYASAWWESV